MDREDERKSGDEEKKDSGDEDENKPASGRHGSKDLSKNTAKSSDQKQTPGKSSDIVPGRSGVATNSPKGCTFDVEVVPTFDWVNTGARPRDLTSQQKTESSTPKSLKKLFKLPSFNLLSSKSNYSPSKSSKSPSKDSALNKKYKKQVTEYVSFYSKADPAKDIDAHPRVAPKVNKPSPDKSTSVELQLSEQIQGKIDSVSASSASFGGDVSEQEGASKIAMLWNMQQRSSESAVPPFVVPNLHIPPSPEINVDMYNEALPGSEILQSDNESKYRQGLISKASKLLGIQLKRDKNRSGSTSPSPSKSQSGFPSVSPSGNPSGFLSVSPSGNPSGFLSVSPSGNPSGFLSVSPSGNPSGFPSVSPSGNPSGFPSVSPSGNPSGFPSVSPSGNPSGFPSLSTSRNPSDFPRVSPSRNPSCFPSASPSRSLNISTSSSRSQSPIGLQQIVDKNTLSVPIASVLISSQIEESRSSLTTLGSIVGNLCQQVSKLPSPSKQRSTSTECKLPHQSRSLFNKEVEKRQEIVSRLETKLLNLPSSSNKESASSSQSRRQQSPSQMDVDPQPSTSSGNVPSERITAGSSTGDYTGVKSTTHQSRNLNRGSDLLHRVRGIIRRPNKKSKKKDRNLSKHK